MEFLTEVLSNPIIAAIGYITSLIAACIAIKQATAKNVANEKIKVLEQNNITLSNENNKLKIKIDQSNNTVKQGQKSQYFHDNSGAVSIDLRG